MSLEDRQRWDAKYAAKSLPDRLAPDDWLVEQASVLPPGRALELACGLGHNAIWLAQQGWQVDAVDVSPAGLELARRFADCHGARVNWIAADLDNFEAESQAYDLVLVFRFLDRRRLPPLIESALRPGGLLLYETFTRAHLSRPDSHMRNPEFALAPGELPRLFPSLAVALYSESDLADRSVARLAAGK
ncbi:MAG TPA: class I SAM-dependent methyltransferase [Planctomycetaceae bacterium]|nr:class I SAM-dependent methyltransferase [Planctomycetaceae bacterium]